MNTILNFFSSILSGIPAILSAIILLVVAIVFSETTLAQINIEVQQLESQVVEQQKVNDSLEMKIDEITSLDNINQISEEYGLSYNSDNVKH